VNKDDIFNAIFENIVATHNFMKRENIPPPPLAFRAVRGERVLALFIS
jgi:hypothetical protein